MFAWACHWASWESWGSDFFARFEDAHPGTSVRYEEVPDIPCDDGLLENRYELALTIFPYNEAFETVDLGSMALSMWVNVDDPLEPQRARRH